MKKKYKKGFFLSETIVVIAVIAVVLLNVFVVYSSVYASFKRSEKYNTSNALTAANNIKVYFESFGEIDKTTLQDNEYIINLTNSSLYSESFYTLIKNEFNVTGVYLVDLANVDSSLSSLNVNLRRYIKTLKSINDVALIVSLSNNEYGYVKIVPLVTYEKCHYSGELTKGAIYTYGDYLYRYKQEFDVSTNSWKDMTSDGWGVTLTDNSRKFSSSISSEICTSITEKNVISMSGLFHDSNATSIDLSSFNTSNITNMSGMFYNSNVTTVDLTKLNTTNVLDTSYMFYNSKLSTIDLSSFNTSKVTNMSYMFYKAASSTINTSTLNTSRVTNMDYMFAGTAISSIDVSNFNINLVSSKYRMFDDTLASVLYCKNSTERKKYEAIPYPSTLHMAIKLPSEYQYVEYIESSGTQYIDTGVTPTNLTVMKFNFRPLEVTGNLILGYYSGSDANDYRFFNYNSNIYFDLPSSKRINGGSCAVGTDYYFEFGNYYVKNLDTDTVLLNGTASSAFTGTNPITIGNYNNTNYAKVRVYSLEIYNGNTLVRDLIPCYRKSDDVAGLYDLVNEVFYTNEGTGTFTVGTAY